MKNNQVKQFIETNKQMQNFLTYLQGEYDFKKEESEIIDNAVKHLGNMNLIFLKIKK